MDKDSNPFPIKWDPSKYALAYERYRHPTNEGRGTLVVRHSTAPAVVGPLPAAELSDATFQQIGYCYLQRLNGLLEHFGYATGGLELPPSWWTALDPETGGKPFGWLPIYPPFPGRGVEPATDPALSSLRLTRRGGEHELDTTVILVAAESIGEGDHCRVLNSVFGLEIVFHLVACGSETNLQISALTVHYPYGSYRTLVELETLVQSRVEILGPLFNLLGEREEEIASLSQLRAPLSYDQLLFLDSPLQPDDPLKLSFEIRGSGAGALPPCGYPVDAAGEDHALTYAFATRFLATDRDYVLHAVAKDARVAHASHEANPRVFEQDPASWRDPGALDKPPARYDWYATRPVRLDEVLDRYRVPVDLEAELDHFREKPGGCDGGIELETDYFIVRNCPRFVPTDPRNPGPKTVCPPWLAVRSNDQSAIAAAWSCLELLRSMHGFGLDLKEYFHRTSGKLQVFYRSGVRPGPGASGQTINARVSLDDDDRDCMLGARPRISLHLALANLTRRARPVPRDGAPTKAEPLGVANSERWMWHEFGHVLIAARLGVLELQFAHSVGDALAAIVSDPYSRLADPRKIANPPGIADPHAIMEKFRGFTYPWVFLTRRHDRCVLNGWSFDGSFQRPVTDAPEHDRKGRKGYLSEQILATALFRVYRVLGGDTNVAWEAAPDYDTREAASKVVVYYIMRALQTFAISPVRADELEAALICADVGLTTALVLALRSRGHRPWRGGQAHKVIRWSFEAQGMHAPPPRAKVHNAPGASPPVDIYIEDRRPCYERTEGGIVRYGPGGYVPVSLDWNAHAKWLASEGSVRVDHRCVTVVVRNRGHETACNVSVRVWIGCVAAPDWESQPGWDRDADISWHGPYHLSASHTDIEPGQCVEFSWSRPEPFPELPDAVAAEATCADDRANSDPAAKLPCAIAVTGVPPRTPRVLTDLVANDNNLALELAEIRPAEVSPA